MSQTHAQNNANQSGSTPGSAAPEAGSAAPRPVPLAGYQAQTNALRPQAQPTLPPAVTDWSRRVRANFARWDTDSDGWLSLPELNEHLANPALQGDDAAALSALHHKIADLEELSNDEVGDENDGVTVADLRAYEQGRAATPDPSVASVEAEHAAGQRAVTAAAQVRAAHGGEHATANSNELFPNGLPSLDALRQGMLGDCYFLAALGGMISRDPSSVVRMIRRNLDGNAVTSYTVAFQGEIGTQTVAPPTDGEIARYSSSGVDGLWLPVIEKAYAQGRGGASVNRQSEIGEGGSISEGIDAFTAGGTDSDDLWCTDVATTKTKLQNALNGRPAKIVTANLHADNDLHLPSGHAYSVLAFDGAVMTLRNPWGHHPAEVPATATGFVKRPNGQFTMTPELFDDIFFQISYQE